MIYLTLTMEVRNTVMIKPRRSLPGSTVALFHPKWPGGESRLLLTRCGTEKAIGSGECRRRQQNFFCTISIFVRILNVLEALLLFFQCPHLISSMCEALRSPKNKPMKSEPPLEKEGEGFICPSFHPSLPLWQ